MRQTGSVCPKNVRGLHFFSIFQKSPGSDTYIVQVLEPSHHNLDDLIPTRKSLLSRLRSMDDQESWQVFFETYWRLIYNTAVRAGLTDAEAQDVVQATVISVSKKMPGFHYDPSKGSFKGWLLCLTKWRIGDQFRRRLPALVQAVADAEDVPGTPLLERLPDPALSDLEARWDAEYNQSLFDAAIRRVKREADVKQYQIFDLCVVRGWSVASVAQALKVNRGRVYRARFQINRQVKNELTRLQREPL